MDYLDKKQDSFQQNEYREEENFSRNYLKNVIPHIRDIIKGLHRRIFDTDQ